MSTPWLLMSWLLTSWWHQQPWFYRCKVISANDLISPWTKMAKTLQTDQKNEMADIQYIPSNMHTVFALLCFVVIIHWLIFQYPSGLLHWHCGNLTIAPVPTKQPWWIWINTSCAFIMNDCITTTKKSTTKPCAYFLGYTVGEETVLTHRHLWDVVVMFEIILKHILWIGILTSSCNYFTWMPQNPVDGQSILVHVMYWDRQATIMPLSKSMLVQINGAVRVLLQGRTH